MKFALGAIAAAIAVVAFVGVKGAAQPAAPSGETSYQRRCATCHNAGAGEPARLGPNLHCVIGRTAGHAPGFDFSDAMRESGLVWDEDSLDVFLEAPSSRVPGTSMVFTGIANEAERHSVVLWLRDGCSENNRENGK